MKINSYLFVYLVLLIPVFSFGQVSTSELDRLLSGKTDVQRAKVYDSLASYHLNVDAKISLFYSEQAYSLIKETNEFKKTGIVLVNRAKALRQLGNYDKALLDLSKALYLFKQAKAKSWISSCNVDFGNIYYTQGEFGKAITSYMEALKIAEDLNDIQMQSVCVNNIGNIYFYKQNFDKAIEFYLRAYDLNKILKDDKKVALTLDNIGLVYFNKGDFDKAMMYQTNSLSIIEKIGDKKSIAETLTNLGGLCVEMDRVPQALAYLKRAYDIHIEIGSKYGASNTLINIADGYRKLGKYKEAIQSLEEGIRISKDIEAKNNLKEAYFSLSQVYEENKKFDQSLKYYKLYSELKDSMINEESNNHINELSAKYESDKKQKEIELLKKDQEVKDEKIARQNIITTTVVVGLILFLILSFIIFLRYKEKKRSHAEIKAQKEVIENKQMEILDSIRYAKRIQQSLLPSEKYIHKILNNRGGQE